VAMAICNASRGVTVEATAGIDAIEVSNCILISYTDSIYKPLPFLSSPPATGASESAVTSPLALLIHHGPVTLMPLAHAAHTAPSNGC
jgi:hypothetical protein